MLRVTARLFSDGQLVGYMLNDGVMNAKFSKQQVWELAKNKEIIDVIASGTIDDPVISGTNGFELKKLPDLNMRTPVRLSEDIKATDLLASRIRLYIELGFDKAEELSKTKKIRDLCVDNFRKELASGKISKDNRNSMSQYFEVINSLGDELSNGIRVARPRGYEIDRQRAEFDSNKDYVLHCTKELKEILLAVSDSMYKAKAKFNNNEIPYSEVEDTMSTYTRYMNTVNSEHSSSTQEYIDTLDNIIRVAKQNEVINTTVIVNTIDELIASLDKELLRITDYEFAPSLIFEKASRLVGYTVKYTGNVPFKTFRFQISPEHKMIPYTIQPGEQICLNRAELSILSSNPLINCKFKNGKLVSGSVKQYNNLNDFLCSCYFSFEAFNGTEISQHDPEIKIPLKSVVDEATINTYFVDARLNKIKQPARQRVSASPESAQSSKQEHFTKEVASNGIFNAFKR